MKKNLLCSMVLFLTSFQQAWALQLNDAPIQKVTVYPNGALIERSIAVRAGERSLRVEGLPANFDIAALKVQSENIDIAAVTYVDSALNKPMGRESTELQAQIKTLEQSIAELDAQIQAAELQNKFLGNITTGNATTVRQQAYEAFLTISKAAAQKSIHEQRLKELRQDLNQIGDHRFNRRVLELQIQAPQSGTVHLAYQVPYATWKPSYKAELNSQTGQLTLTRMAMISQKTGEDWDSVQLNLSTNSPKAVLENIAPEPWLVNYDEPEKRSAPVPIMAEAAMPVTLQAKAAYTRSAASAEEDMDFPRFEQVEHRYSTQFTTATKASIPSSKQQIALALDQQQIMTKLSAWVVPQQQQRAYLYAEIPHLSGDYPQGQIKLYRDGDYIGERTWQTPNNEINYLGFGEDERIVVKVLDQQRVQAQSGTFNKQAMTTLSKRYQVINNHRQTMPIWLFESVPQSQNTALKVTNQFSHTPTSTAWQGQKGIYQWSNILAPQQHFELELNYQLKYPNEGYASGF